MNDNVLISVKNVSFRYNDELTLENINLDVTRGEFLGIIGPNGSGKTTLLKIMLGLIAPSEGIVEIFGQSINSFKEWSKIGYVHQRAGITSAQFPITVYEIVEMAQKKHNRNAVVKALEDVGMIDHRTRLLRELSGGQQQRIFIARALATNPELLILDEPTVGVDTESQTQFYQLLTDLHQEHNLTIILVSHDLDVVAHEVSEVVCINRTLIGHGKPKDMLKGNFMEKLYGKELRYVVHGH